MRALVCRIEISYKCSATHTEGMECGSSFTQVHLRMGQNATRSWKLDFKDWETS
ncbi:hypothetical protein C0J52_16882 [Blattella germanica]|nr:hypothetical protein C0J52_16882 [Blattella germanica]